VFKLVDSSPGSSSEAKRRKVNSGSGVGGAATAIREDADEDAEEEAAVPPPPGDEDAEANKASFLGGFFLRKSSRGSEGRTGADGSTAETLPGLDQATTKVVVEQKRPTTEGRGKANSGDECEIQIVATATTRRPGRGGGGAIPFL
jgi:hypothetical protein